MKPIESRGEKNEAEEGFGEFLVAGADAAKAFEASVGVFNRVAVDIESRAEEIVFRRRALVGMQVRRP